MTDIAVIGADGLASFLAKNGMEVIGHGAVRRDARAMLESATQVATFPVIAHRSGGVLTRLRQLKTTGFEVVELVTDEADKTEGMPAVVLPCDISEILLAIDVDRPDLSGTVDIDGGVTIDAEPEPTIDAEPEPIEPEPTIDAEPEPIEPEPTIDAEPEPIEPEPTIDAEPEPIEPEPTIDAEPEPIERMPAVVAEPEPIEPEPTIDAEPEPIERMPAVVASTAIESAPEVDEPAQVRRVVPQIERPTDQTDSVPSPEPIAPTPPVTERPEAAPVWERGTSARMLGNVVFVISRRGQVGKSAITVRMAETARRAGVRTILIDGDFEDGDVERGTRATGPNMYDISQNWDGTTQSLIQFGAKDPNLKVPMILAASNDQFQQGSVTPSLYAAVIQAASELADLVIVDCHPTENRKGEVRVESYRQQWFDEVVMPRMGVNSRDFLSIVTSVDSSVAQTTFEWLATLKAKGVDASRIRLLVSTVSNNRSLHAEQVRASFRTYTGFVIPFSDTVHSDALKRQVSLDNPEYQEAVHQVLYAITNRKVFAPAPPERKRRWFGR